MSGDLVPREQSAVSMQAVSMSDMQRMAEAMAKSKLFGVKTADEALSLMLVSYAEGRHPALAARDYDIIQGRPAKKSEAMMRDFLQSGGSVEWHQLDDTAAIATFSHPQGGSVKIDWTMKRAMAAGVGGRDMWKKYPRQMLRSRTVSEGIRTVCPMATSGMYVVEEVQDIAKERNITPNAGAGESLTQERRNWIDEVAGKVQEWIDSGSIGDAFAEAENAGMDNDDKLYFWSMFDSKARSALKREAERVRAQHAALPAPLEATETAPEGTTAKPDKVISAAQHKRLEARIKELGRDREEIKAYVLKKWGVAHFPDLTDKQYTILDGELELSAAFPESAPPESVPARSPAVTQGAQGGADPVYITPEQAMEIESQCDELGIAAEFKKASKIERYMQLEAHRLAGAKDWIAKRAKAGAAK